MDSPKAKIPVYPWILFELRLSPVLHRGTRVARDCGAYMGSVALFTETIFVAESRGRISQTWLAGTWLISAVIFIVIAIIYYFLCRWKYSSRMTCDSGFNINYIVRVKEGQKKNKHIRTHWNMLLYSQTFHTDQRWRHCATDDREARLSGATERTVFKYLLQMWKFRCNQGRT